MRRLIGAALLATMLASCTESTPRAFEAIEAGDRGPIVLVTQPMLADVVDQVVAGHGTVSLLSDGTDGSDPLARLREADLLVRHVAAPPGGDGLGDLGEDAPRQVAVNDWLDETPVNDATWFDPISMATITIELGELLAEVDDDQLRTADDWRAAARAVATSIATVFDDAEALLARVPGPCRRATGDPRLLEHLQERFGVRAADAGDEGAADLTTIEDTPTPGQRWQDWFLGIIERLSEADPECADPAPSPSPS